MSRERKPFHESIIFRIKQANSDDLVNVIAPFIKETIIPAGHDAIVAAWKKRCGEVYSYGIEDDPHGVLADLEEQKQEAAEKERAKAEASGTCCGFVDQI